MTGTARESRDVIGGDKNSKVYIPSLHFTTVGSTYSGTYQNPLKLPKRHSKKANAVN